MWWSVTTLTTVGYGDICPVTIWGKALAAVVAILGIGVFALPTGIIGAGFVEEMQARKKRPSGRTCPHCGGQLSD
jgi:voltage-gated potassium channel